MAIENPELTEMGKGGTVTNSELEEFRVFLHRSTL